MSIHIYVLNASGNLTPFDDEIRRTVKKVLHRTDKMLDLENLDIVVREQSDVASLQDLGGLGGSCPNAHLVQIVLDPKHAELKKRLPEFLAYTLAHELHHVARGYNLSSAEPITFWDALVGEGLADAFASEITDNRAVWTQPLDRRAHRRLKKRLQPLLNQRLSDQDYADWFAVGNLNKHISRWTGYSLGFALVQQYLHSHPKEDAATLVDIKSKKMARTFEKI